MEWPPGSWLDLAAASWVGGLAAVKYPPVRLPENWYEVGPNRKFWECAFWLPMAHSGFPRVIDWPHWDGLGYYYELRFS